MGKRWDSGEGGTEPGTRPGEASAAAAPQLPRRGQGPRHLPAAPGDRGRRRRLRSKWRLRNARHPPATWPRRPKLRRPGRVLGPRAGPAGAATHPQTGSPGWRSSGTWTAASWRPSQPGPNHINRGGGGSSGWGSRRLLRRGNAAYRAGRRARLPLAPSLPCSLAQPPRTDRAGPPPTTHPRDRARPRQHRLPPPPPPGPERAGVRRGDGGGTVLL